jgi:hypothetical protein
VAERIQLRRTKGWRKPEGAVSVARPSRWRNPYAVRRNRVPAGRPGSGSYSETGPFWTVVHVDKWGIESGARWGAWDSKRTATEFAIDLFRQSLNAAFTDLDGEHTRTHYLGDLVGHDLACWCPLDQPCHADVLLELANAQERDVSLGRRLRLILRVPPVTDLELAAPAVVDEHRPPVPVELGTLEPVVAVDPQSVRAPHDDRREQPGPVLGAVAGHAEVVAVPAAVGLVPVQNDHDTNVRPCVADVQVGPSRPGALAVPTQDIDDLDGQRPGCLACGQVLALPIDPRNPNDRCAHCRATARTTP